MISHGKNIKIFSGNSHPALAMQIASALGLPIGKAAISTFADGEISVSISESVRGSDVFLVQSTCGPVNNNLMELLIMIDSCKRASAGRITAVIPYFGYARQDRKSKARDPISAKLVADLITAAGADRVLTMDLHAAQIQGFFDIPVDNMLGSSVLIPYIAGKFGVGTDDTVIVSPDLGSVTRARKFTQKLDMPLAIIDKRRPKANVSEVMNIIGNVRGQEVHSGRRPDRHRRHARTCSGGAGRARRRDRGLRLRKPRRSVRPGDRAHPEQPDQGADHPRHHPADAMTRSWTRSTCCRLHRCSPRRSRASTRKLRFPPCSIKILHGKELLHGCSSSFCIYFLHRLSGGHELPQACSLLTGRQLFQHRLSGGHERRQRVRP